MRRPESCTAYFPGDPYRVDRPCASCEWPLEEHWGTYHGDLLAEAEAVFRLLMNYGHSCTVHNLMPALKRAIVAEHARRDQS